MDTKYVELQNDGSYLWDDVRHSVVQSVSVQEFDDLVAAGYIDLDGRILVELDCSDD